MRPLPDYEVMDQERFVSNLAQQNNPWYWWNYHLWCRIDWLNGVDSSNAFWIGLNKNRIWTGDWLWMNGQWFSGAWLFFKVVIWCWLGYLLWMWIRLGVILMLEGGIPQAHVAANFSVSMIFKLKKKKKKKNFKTLCDRWCQRQTKKSKEDHSACAWTGELQHLNCREDFETVIMAEIFLNNQLGVGCTQLIWTC